MAQLSYTFFFLVAQFELCFSSFGQKPGFMLTFVKTFVCSIIVLSLAVLLKVSFSDFSIQSFFNKTGWSLSSIVGSCWDLLILG